MSHSRLETDILLSESTFQRLWMTTWNSDWNYQILPIQDPVYRHLCYPPLSLSETDLTPTAEVSSSFVSSYLSSTFVSSREFSSRDDEFILNPYLSGSLPLFAASTFVRYPNVILSLPSTTQQIPLFMQQHRWVLISSRPSAQFLQANNLEAAQAVISRDGREFISYLRYNGRISTRLLTLARQENARVEVFVRTARASREGLSTPPPPPNPSSAASTSSRSAFLPRAAPSAVRAAAPVRTGLAANTARAARNEVLNNVGITAEIRRIFTDPAMRRLLWLELIALFNSGWAYVARAGAAVWGGAQWAGSLCLRCAGGLAGLIALLAGGFAAPIAAENLRRQEELNNPFSSNWTS